jgi:hypothetical protein
MLDAHLAKADNTGPSTRTFYLKCWKGGVHLKDRVGKGKNDPTAEIRVDNLAVSILGAIPTDELDLRKLTGDGLLQRFLPTLVASARRGDQYYQVDDVERDYEKLIRSINNEPQKCYRSPRKHCRCAIAFWIIFTT